MLLPDEMNVRFWKVPASNDFNFPEQNPDEELHYKPIISRLANKRCGIAFSGGGTVSAALAPGFIKALVDMKLMDNVSYISGVSGGTWGTAAFCYAQNEEWQQKYYAGVMLPGEISVDQKPPEPSMIAANTKAPIGRDTLLRFENPLNLYKQNSFTDAVGEIFLKPFELYSKTTKYFSTDQDTVTKILERNPHLSADDFIVLAPNSPYYIMNGTLLTPPQSIKVKVKNDQNKDVVIDATFDGTYTAYPFEFTPLYCGTKGNQGADTTGEIIGGAYAESFGTDTPIMVQNNDGRSVTVKKQTKPFTLSSPVGTSGSAIEKLVIEKFPKLSGALPAFQYWNPNDKEPISQEYFFGDGGISENTGVAALLARKIDNIVLFITEPFDPTPISTKACEKVQRKFGHNQMAKLFGAPILQDGAEEPFYDATTQFFKTDDFMRYGGLKDQLNAKKANLDPIIVTGTYDVLQNKHFGIEGGWQATITWVIIDTCKEFNGSLSGSFFENGKDGKMIKDLENFPAICTFEQNVPNLIQLTNNQANLLASQAYWMALHNPEIIETLSHRDL